MLLERYGLTVSFLRHGWSARKADWHRACVRIDGRGNPFIASVGFRVEVGKPGSGITYSYEVQLVRCHLCCTARLKRPSTMC